MDESGPHKQSILRNKEVSLKNAPRKPRDVTRPTVMVKRLGFRGTLPVKYKIDFWNNPITASILVWNQVVLNQSQQLGYLNSKLMLSWDCPFKRGVLDGSPLCMSGCASICEILISYWTLRIFEMKNDRLGQRRKKAIFSSALPQGDYAMLITLASV